MKKQIRSLVIAIVIFSLAGAGFASKVKGIEIRSFPVEPIVVAY